MAIALLTIYYAALAAVTVYSVHRLALIWLLRAHREDREPIPAHRNRWPSITVQLPLYNEPTVAERLIEAAARFEYSGDIDIQVLDDSTDETTALIASAIQRLPSGGVAIEHIRRGSRDGYKAGALAFGMERSNAELFAIFDADFLPDPKTLIRMVFAFNDCNVGMVQARWGHLNRDESALTRAQAIFLDAHFAVESAARFAAGRFFNFNGTAGIWRRAAIDDAGGWSAATLTEDLDLSYRAQLAGWKFVFLPEVEVPAELPPTIGAFHEQQFRWAKGSMQTARRLLGRIVRGRLSIANKIEAFFHLTANSAYALTLLVAMFMVPSMTMRRDLHATWLYLIDALLFAMSTLSVIWFYVVGQRQIGRTRPPWRDLAMLMPIGIGLSARNSAAVVEGLLTRGGEFNRTPKRGATSLLAERVGRLPIAESLLAVYFGAAIASAFFDRQFAGMPFFALFLGGFAYTATQSWRERWSTRSSRSTDRLKPLQPRPYTSVIIPALDEQEAIGHVLRDIPRNCVDDVIVVDNGSRDQTAVVAAAASARVVRENRRGYGAACLAGIAALNEATEVVVFLDADYSDFPEDLPRLLRPICEGRADFVIGTRMLDQDARSALSIAQRCGNWLATRLIRMFWHQTYSDLGPFRAITKEALARLSISDRGFGWNVEMQIKAARQSLRIVEIPVRYRPRIGKSKISGTVRGTFLAGTKILYTIGKYAWRY